MGIPPKVLVTGLGVSGTTYVIRLIGACGFDLGHIHHGMDDRKGWEWEPLWNLSVEIWSALGRRAYEPIMPEWNHIQPERIDEIRNQFEARIEAIECPPAVKLPEANPILLTCLRPGLVIFMHRPLDSWLASLVGDPKYSHMTRYELFHGAMIAQGLLLETLETEQIPYTVVDYPRVAQDRHYAWDKIGRALQVDRQVFDAAHTTVTRSDWIDWTTKNAESLRNDGSLLEPKTSASRAVRKLELPWTGERLVPTASGEFVVEHLHRYAIARDLAAGKTVLDIASGEGYGASLLAETAKRVIGVDIEPDTVRHAQARYGRKNLAFALGECARIPLNTASVDLVASFETIEHHDQHEAMITEFKRILKVDGALIISSPNKREYSDLPAFKNPFHVLELYLDQFETLLKSHFRNVHVYGQRVSSGSYIAPIRLMSDGSQPLYKTYKGNFSQIQSECGVDRPLYFIAVASNGYLPPVNAGLFEGERFLLQHKEEVVTALTDQVRALKTQAADAQRQCADALQQVAKLRQDNERLQIFADTVRRTLAYRLYRKLIKPFKSN